MPESKPEDQPAKSRRKGRRVPFVLLSIAVLALIGLGGLQVFGPGERGEPENDLSDQPSASVLDEMSSDAASALDKSRASAPEESSDSDPEAESDADESYVSNTAGSEFAENSSGEQKALSISGAVMDDTGNLLPGIPVLARPADRPVPGQAGTRTGAAELRRRTDQLGSFSFDNLLEGEYELSIAETEQYNAVKLLVRAGVANAELVLQRIRPVIVYGKITDDVGNLLEGVQVRALGSKLKVLSSTSGDYEILIEPSKAGQPPVLDFSLEGYQDARQRVEGVLGSEAPEVRLDVQLEWESNAPKVAVYGLVFGPGTEPVAGATVWLSSPEFNLFERTRSGSSGEYRFDGVRTGDAYTLGVDPRGKKYAVFRSESLSIGPTDFNYDVKLEATGFADLSGTLTDLSGAPLGDFTLWARNTDMARQKPITVRTDGAGQFRLEQIPSGSIKLESRSQPWLQVSGILLKPGDSRRVDVPLDWGRRWLLGQVVDDQGNPVSRAKVVLQWTRSFADLRSQSRREVMSDQGGYFALSNLDADQYSVSVRATGFAPSRIDHQMSGSEEELRVVLSRGN